MAVLSTLFRICTAYNVSNFTNISKILLNKQQNAIKQSFRQMSGGDDDRTMHITPSRHTYTRFKDDLHFYISLGVIPLGLLIFFVNVFIGPATLTETPEGYTPEHFEYFKSPIKRFLSTLYEDPQVSYEKTLQFLQQEMERAEWQEKIKKAKTLMAERDDYKEWYHIPSEQGRRYRKARKLWDDLQEDKGYR